MIERQAERVITSKPLTIEQVSFLHWEFDCDLEKEFRKYESFYAYGFVEITQEMIDAIEEEFGLDIQDQLGMGYQLVGMWSDMDGTDWNYASLQYAEEVYIPEQIIVKPAYLEKRWTDYKGI